MKYADDYTGYGNEVLYRMCEEQPLHTVTNIIRDKIWLIGRAYSAAIERKAGKDFNSSVAADVIKASDIDTQISMLRAIKRPTIENLHILLTAHKKLTEIFKEVTGLEKRSLASKYLHFHAPKAVFIYDSIAKRKLLEIVGKQKFDVEGICSQVYIFSRCHIRKRN